MDQVEYFRTHPPRCVTRFGVRSTDLPGVAFDGHASLSQLKSRMQSGIKIEAPEHINPVFSLSCSCSGRHFFVHGYRWINPDYHNAEVFLSPLVLECQACKRRTELLDTDIHGYDGELGHGTTTARGQVVATVFDCPACRPHAVAPFFRFSHPDDLFDADLPEFAGREQDLFTWFSLLGRGTN